MRRCFRDRWRQGRNLGRRRHGSRSLGTDGATRRDHHGNIGKHTPQGRLCTHQDEIRRPAIDHQPFDEVLDAAQRIGQGIDHVVIGRLARTGKHVTHVVSATSQDAGGASEFGKPQRAAHGVQPLGQHRKQLWIINRVGEIRDLLLGLLEASLHLAAERDACALQRMATRLGVTHVTAGIDHSRRQTLINLEQGHGDLGKTVVELIARGNASGDPCELRREDFDLLAIAHTGKQRTHTPQLGFDLAQYLPDGQGIALGALQLTQHPRKIRRDHTDCRTRGT